MMNSIERVHKLLTAKRDVIRILYNKILDDAVTDGTTDREDLHHDLLHELIILDDVLSLMTSESYLTEKERIYKEVYNKED